MFICVRSGTVCKWSQIPGGAWRRFSSPPVSQMAALFSSKWENCGEAKVRSSTSYCYIFHECSSLSNEKGSSLPNLGIMCEDGSGRRVLKTFEVIEVVVWESVPVWG